MRKSCTLYTIYGEEVTIVEAQALSNKVLYLQVEFPRGANSGGYTLEYVAENSKSACVAKRLTYLCGFDVLFLDKQEQEYRQRIELNAEHAQYIGQKLDELFKALKR